jgi:transposase InsO family protein
LERFFRSLKDECLSRMTFFDEKSLRNATAQFVEHFHAERNHQGLGNKLIEPGAEVDQATGEVEYRERLGGLLNYSHRRGEPRRKPAADAHPIAKEPACTALSPRADRRKRPSPRP